MSTTLSSRARAVADTSAGTILATVEIAAPPERVFRALTTDEITKWWGSADSYRTTEYTGDVRPGGRWRSVGVGADGQSFSVEGEFREVDPPHRLVQTWRAAWDGGNETVITYRLEAIDGGTRLTLRHEGFGDRVDSCRGHGEGWERVLGWLAGFTAPAPEAASYFFCRLLPPRPTFMADMNAAEAEIMRAHAGYWRGLLDQGTAVVFGPVGGPTGGWGLGVIRAANSEAMTALSEADPAIRSGRGFRYEIAPLLRAIHRA
jgi:uncharacterized protein YndB with AHSA1/START domain/uncharacterized protein YciI